MRVIMNSTSDTKLMGNAELLNAYDSAIRKTRPVHLNCTKDEEQAYLDWAELRSEMQRRLGVNK